MSYFEESGDEGPVRSTFIPNACHICKTMYEKRPTDEVDGAARVSSCSACRMIAYCGVEHQKEHWQEHKVLCKAVQAIMRRDKKKSLFADASISHLSKDQWKMVRYNTMVNLEEAMSRSMLPYEREMLLYPRVCATCYTDQGSKLNQCDQCQSVFFCCEQHIPKNHSDWCADLKTLLDINIEQSIYGNILCALPHLLLKEYEDLPPSMKEFLVVRMMGPAAVMAMGKIKLTMLTELATYPLSILWGLQEASKAAAAQGEIAPISSRKSLVVHVVGAEIAFECNNLAKWDVFLLNTLPGLQSLYVIFTGPELGNVPAGTWDEDMRCPHCIRNKKQFVCDFQPATLYHDYVNSSNYISPDVIVAFNCGLYRETGFQGSDSWGKTLPYLLKAGVPLILTAYTAAEAPLDLKRLQQQSKHPLQVLLPSQKNPYRSTRPCKNFVSEEESPLIFKNQYITVVKGITKSTKQ